MTFSTIKIEMMICTIFSESHIIFCGNEDIDVEHLILLKLNIIIHAHLTCHITSLISFFYNMYFVVKNSPDQRAVGYC